MGRGCHEPGSRVRVIFRQSLVSPHTCIQRMTAISPDPRPGLPETKCRFELTHRAQAPSVSVCTSTQEVLAAQWPTSRFSHPIRAKILQGLEEQGSVLMLSPQTREPCHQPLALARSLPYQPNT